MWLQQRSDKGTRDDAEEAERIKVYEGSAILTLRKIDLPLSLKTGGSKTISCKKGKQEGKKQEGINLSRPIRAVGEKKDNHTLEGEW